MEIIWGESQEKVIGKKAGFGFRITERDFDLLAFLYDQKFASLSVLYFRFFDRRTKVDESVPSNFWVTRQRIAVLRQAGLIASQRVYTDSKALYLLTKSGYEILKTKRDLGLSKDPVTSVDFRYFEHDKRVTLCRVALERHGKSLKWFSDRYLHVKGGYPLASGRFVRLQVAVIPDGVFLSSKNEYVALELEHTSKKRDRYEDKRLHYQRLFQSSEGTLGGGEPALHRVVLVATNERIRRDLEEFYGRHLKFQVLNFDRFIGSYLGKDALV